MAVPGALLSVGDSHASQGDSELCGTAIRDEHEMGPQRDIER